MAFWSKRTETAEVSEKPKSPPPPPAPKKPKGEIPKSKVVELGIYEKLAGELGFSPAQLLTERLIKFMEKNNIKRFAYAEVGEYMRHEAQKAKRSWCWRPLREKDIVDYAWGSRDNIRRDNGWFGYDFYHKKYLECRPYDKAVPIDVLRNVKKIQDEFGDDLKFFVSDYAIPSPDPFIMVTAMDIPRIVFGVWDEPNFGV